MRIYDNRVARFLSVDPITNQYPELTPYQFASNRPIDGIDRDGLEHERIVGGSAPDFSLFNMFLPKEKQLSSVTTEAMKKSYQKGVAAGTVAGAAITADLYTGGKITTGMVMFGGFYHNKGKTPQARVMQSKDAWNHISQAGMMWATGMVVGKSLEVATPILAETSNLIRLTRERVSISFENGKLYSGIPLPKFKIKNVTNSANEVVPRNLVANEDELLQVAEHYMSEMKNVQEIKPGWYEGLMPMA